MKTTDNNRHTLAEYLELEETSKEKHEFYDGEIFTMSGGTYNHSLICNNVGRAIGNALEKNDKDCSVLNSDMRIALDFTNAFVYPDGSVVCGKPQFSLKDKNSLANPLLIIEVLSEGTRAYDRGEKFWKYKHLPSFKEYVIIEQKMPLVEVSSRQPDGSWNTVTSIGLENSVRLHSLDCTISMKEIYSRASDLQQPNLRLFVEE